MARIFVDSGAWIALIDPSDRLHSAARPYFRDLTGADKLVTSNYVVQEVVTWFVYHRRHRYVLPFRQLIEASELTHLLERVWTTRELDEAAWEIYEQFADQRFSFADCNSIALCREEDINTAFSFDRHFTIAGLTRVPTS